MGFLDDITHIAGNFVGSIGRAAARTHATETDIAHAEDRIDQAVDGASAWSASDIARVLTAADPLSLVGREDAGRLYLGIAARILQATFAGERTAKTIRSGIEAGIDELPEGVRIYTKRGAVKKLSESLAGMAAELQ